MLSIGWISIQCRDNTSGLTNTYRISIVFFYKALQKPIQTQKTLLSFDSKLAPTHLIFGQVKPQPVFIVAPLSPVSFVFLKFWLVYSTACTCYDCTKYFDFINGIFNSSISYNVLKSWYKGGVQNKGFGGVSQTDFTRVEFWLWRRIVETTQRSTSAL